MHLQALRAGVAPRSFRPVLVLAAAACIALAACTGGGASPTAAPSEGVASVPFEGTDWQLAEYVGRAGGVVRIPAAVTVTATFAGGNVAGGSGCNTYRGPYTIDGATIAIGQLAVTAMACTGAAAPVEEAYLQILPLMTRFAVTGDALEMSNESGAILLRFAVRESSSLTQTRWLATGVNNGVGGVESVVAGTELTAIFGEDGTVTGSGGCNTFSGPYTVDGDAIEIGPLASTRKACEEAVMAQEAAYLQALDNATTYAITGDALELRDAAGALQAGFMATAAAE